jgi:hypothetical protein
LATAPGRLPAPDGAPVGGPIEKEEHLMAIHPELLEILACPQCKGDLRLNRTQDGLICDRCRLVYEIRDDIPIMLIDEAKPLPEN